RPTEIRPHTPRRALQPEAVQFQPLLHPDVAFLHDGHTSLDISTARRETLSLFGVVISHQDPNRVIDIVLGDILDGHPYLGSQFTIELSLGSDDETARGRIRAQY